MGLNTQFPSWVAQGQLASQELGQQMGRNILEGLRFQEQKRQEERRIPLLNAQTELMKANVAQQLLQNQQQATAANLFNEQRAAQTEALALESGINRSEGKWTSPENRAIFLDFMKRNPALSGSSWDQNMRKQFGEAEKLAADEAKYRALIEGRQRVAETKLQFNDRNTSQASWDEVTNLMGQGYDEMEAFKTLRDNATGAYSGKVKMNVDTILSELSTLKREGIPYTQSEVQDFWSRLSMGGQAATSNKKELSQAISEDKTFNLLNEASNLIDEFDRKYGKGAFDDYVGPYDSRRLKFQNAVINPKDLPQANREANRIFQKVNGIIQGYRNNQFGTALTASETQVFKDIIADNTSANYADSIRNFRDNIADSVRFVVSENKISPILPISLKKRWASAYGGVGGAAGQPAQIPTGGAQMQPQQPAGQPTQGGVKILSITPLP